MGIKKKLLRKAVLRLVPVLTPRRLRLRIAVRAGRWAGEQIAHTLLKRKRRRTRSTRAR